MSLVLKKHLEIKIFTNLIYHLSFCAFLTLLIIHNAALAINIIIYVIGTTLVALIMTAIERSERIVSCLVDTLLCYAINYFDDEQNKKVSSEQGSFKTIMENASKRQSSRVMKKGVAGVVAAPKTPVVSAEIVKKSEAARRNGGNGSKLSNKPTEVARLFSMFGELSLRKTAKSQLPLELQSRPCVPSSLGQNRPKDWKPTDCRPSKRYSTPASEKQKRTMAMKFICSTATNRIAMRRKQSRQDNRGERKQKKSTKVIKPELKDKNLRLFDERPLLSQPVRTFNVDQTPRAYLQSSRKCLEFMIKVKKHRNTI